MQIPNLPTGSPTPITGLTKSEVGPDGAVVGRLLIPTEAGASKRKKQPQKEREEICGDTNRVRLLGYNFCRLSVRSSLPQPDVIFGKRLKLASTAFCRPRKALNSVVAVTASVRVTALAGICLRICNASPTGELRPASSSFSDLDGLEIQRPSRPARHRRKTRLGVRDSRRCSSVMLGSTPSCRRRKQGEGEVTERSHARGPIVDSTHGEC